MVWLIHGHFRVFGQVRVSNCFWICSWSKVHDLFAGNSFVWCLQNCCIVSSELQQSKVDKKSTFVDFYGTSLFCDFKTLRIKHKMSTKSRQKVDKCRLLSTFGLGSENAKYTGGLLSFTGILPCVIPICRIQSWWSCEMSGMQWPWMGCMAWCWWHCRRAWLFLCLAVAGHSSQVFCWRPLMPNPCIFRIINFWSWLLKWAFTPEACIHSRQEVLHEGDS